MKIYFKKMNRTNTHLIALQAFFKNEINNNNLKQNKEMFIIATLVIKKHNEVNKKTSIIKISLC